MIKGVNKRILEVTFPENEHFEKAVVFLRSETPGSDIYGEAEATVSKLERELDLSQKSGFHGIKKAAADMTSLLFKLSVIICAAAAVMNFIS